MVFRISEKNNVYVVAPAASATGGPELLHQFAYTLKHEIGLKNVFMYYLPNNTKNPVHEAYMEYDIPYVTNIVDDERNILVVPEVFTEVLDEFKNIKKVIWWLSVDNYYFSFRLPSFSIFGKNFRIYSLINRLLLNLNIQKYLFFNNNLKNIKYHFVQSEYAKMHLHNKGILEPNIYDLSDYLNKNFLELKAEKNAKKNIVAYNPKKGYRFTKKLITYVSKNSKDIVFEPIQNMTREEVIHLLMNAKVYIDFGNFPGKDRIPREAAILDCCVITGKKGASGFLKDVPILDQYKFKDDKNNFKKIFSKISQCMYDYDNEIKNFENYKDVIQNEESEFVSRVKEIFKKLPK